jgi:hypothetical protein
MGKEIPSKREESLTLMMTVCFQRICGGCLLSLNQGNIVLINLYRIAGPVVGLKI